MNISRKTNQLFRFTAGILFAFVLAATIALPGCDKEEEPIDVDDLVRRVLDSLSYLHPDVEVYEGIDGGGINPIEPIDDAALPYAQENRYRTVSIPGGLKVGDQVFAVAELRFATTGSPDFTVLPQSCITITDNASVHPDPGISPSNIFYIAESGRESWYMEAAPWYTVDRSGSYTQQDSTGTWSAAYVNLYGRMFYDGSESTADFDVGGLKLTVIVVRD